MNSLEYQTLKREIKRRNRIKFGATLIGIIAFAIGAKVSTNNLDISKLEKIDILNNVYNICLVTTIGSSYFFAIREPKQLNRLGEYFKGIH